MIDHVNTYQNILELIGNTPLIKLNNIVKEYDGAFYAKFEALIRVIQTRTELQSIL